MRNESVISHQPDFEKKAPYDYMAGHRVQMSYLISWYHTTESWCHDIVTSWHHDTLTPKFENRVNKNINSFKLLLGNLK